MSWVVFCSVVGNKLVISINVKKFVKMLKNVKKTDKVMKSSYRVVWSCLCGWALSHTNNMTEANRSPPRDQCSPNKEYLSGLVLFNVIVCVCFFVWECKNCVMFILGPFHVWGKISFQEDDDIAGFIICMWLNQITHDYLGNTANIFIHCSISVVQCINN